MLLRLTRIGAVCAFAMSTPASAERLTLNILPPDLPPGNICSVESERFGDEETQIADTGEDERLLDDEARLGYLARDINSLQRNEPDTAFAFIMELIAKRAELDPEYAGIEETFDRIDTYIYAGHMDELAQSGLIEGLVQNIELLGWTDTVRLARYYRNGMGVARDRDFAVRLILDQAYLGNADALLEILRMQLRGVEVPEWVLTKEATANLAFGGLIGKMNRGLCFRAERMAREYIDGDILTPNPELAYAWRKFAADMGGGEAAWRVVEHHLGATDARKSNAELRHYLQMAVANGAVIYPETVEDIVARGVQTEAEIRELLGMNHGRVGSDNRASAVPYLEMGVKLSSNDIREGGEYLEYLKEIAQLPGAPASVLTRLAKETLLREGMWKGRRSAEEHLIRAHEMGDTEATRLLAQYALSERQNPEQLAEAEALLLHAVEVLGDTDALEALDGFYRCQSPGAPLVHEADFWAGRYRVAGTEAVSISETDLARIDPLREPEAVARIQSLALRRHGSATANWLQYLQSDPSVSPEVLSYWARRVSQSDAALETFVLQEVELAATPRQRESAMELLRRAYLEIGPAIFLETAVALVEHAGRDADVADEIVEILDASARRGEGAAIRLLQRLTGRDGADVYRDYAAAIEARGDFLAHIFAAPFLAEDTFDRYMDRAVSLMTCGTKDIAELTDAYARRGLTDDVAHWTRVGLALEHGNALTKLGLSDRQMDDFNRGASVVHDTFAPSTPAGADFDDLRRAYLALSDPGAPAFDAEAAGERLAAIFAAGDREQYLWALERYRLADPSVRESLDALIDIWPGLTAAADAGDSDAQFALGVLKRSLGGTVADLRQSADYLRAAAESGHVDAMLEYAQAVGFGIGTTADPKMALIWLERAQRIEPKRGGELRSILNAMASP